MLTNDMSRTVWVIPTMRPLMWRAGRYMTTGEHVELVRIVDANTVIVRAAGGYARLHPSMLDDI